MDRYNVLSLGQRLRQDDLSGVGVILLVNLLQTIHQLEGVGEDPPPGETHNGYMEARFSGYF